MRIVGFFIRWIFILALLAAGVYFFTGQMWMAITTRGFLADLKKVQDATLNTRQYISQCQKAPAASTLSNAIAVQLRFVDEKNYQLELRCTLIEDAPVLLSKGTLPLFVTKAPGSSGLYVDLTSAASSSVTLKAFAATKVFSVDTSEQFYGATSIPSAPATQCIGWGGRCCSPEQERGEGAQQREGVLDCANNCFAACTALPYIQAFSSDPYPTTPGVVSMTSDSVTVTFAYTASLLNGKIASVHMDFGDGQSEDSTLPIGAFVHTYTCAGPCSNQAVITAKDAKGNSSVVNSSTTIYIKKQ